MNYTDLGLNAENIVTLKKSARRTGWRVKALKPKGLQLLDPATAVPTKIDIDGTYSKYVLDTDGEKYVKLLHDEKSNRSFVLHYARMNSDDAVVSIINHDRATTDTKYIEKINKDTCADWPTDYLVSYAYDMDYNPDTQELAIAMNGLTPGYATTYGPALTLIDCARNISELETNYCSRLKENPDYFSCRLLRAPDELQDCGSESYVKFVRYHQGRWWTWTRVRDYGAIPGPGEYNIFWQLGYFDVADEFTLCFQYGWAQSPGTGRPDGGDFDPTIMYPTQPRWRPVYDSETVVTGTTDGYLGDPTLGFANVTAFEIYPEDGGWIVMATSPTDTTDNINHGFGMEPFIYRLSIPLLLNELNAADRLLDTKSASVAAVYDEDEECYLIPNTFVEVTFDGLGGKTGGGMVSVRCDAVYGTTAYLYMQGDFGTSAAGGLYSDNVMSAHGCNFVCGDTCTVKLPVAGAHKTSENPFSVVYTFKIYKQIPGLVEVIGIHSNPPLVRADDADRPQTATGQTTSPVTINIEVARLMYTTGVFVETTDVFFDSVNGKYLIAVHDPTSYMLGRGMWLYEPGVAGAAGKIKYLTTSNGLAYDYVGAVKRVNGSMAAVASNESTPPYYYGDIAKVQFYNTAKGEFVGDTFEAELAWEDTGASGVFCDVKNNSCGLATNRSLGHGVGGEIWIWEASESDDGTKWSRDIRKWWDGSEPDIVLGAGATATDSLGQPASFFNPSWRQSKGKSSYEFSFDVAGADYLPWMESPINENADAAGTYDGALQDATRLVVERGVWDGREWTWVAEGQTFVLAAPAEAAEGIATMHVTSMGAISMLVTRATYAGYHVPDIDVYSDVSLTTEDNKTFYYAPGGTRVTEWVVRPSPEIKVDGEDPPGYTLDSSVGTVTFTESMEGRAVTASFSAYTPGTNEAEDIIRCILTYPQELGGCGLDESYITRRVSGVALDTENNLTYSFPIDNIVPLDSFNAVYRDGVKMTSGFEWDERAGVVTFTASQAGHTMTGDAKHYTIRKSGVTLRPLNLNVREQKSAYDAIQEVCRRVSPNYIFREGRDGRLECGYFTQKETDLEDIVINDDDVVITALNSNPMYEGLATRVISLGQAELEELPDYALGCEVTNLWPYAWHAGTDLQSVTDGSPGTGATSGYGRWDEGTYAVQSALIAAGDDGIPCLSVDLGERREVYTIIIARPAQASTEGDAGAVQAMSVWVSDDGSGWVRIVNAFELGPGQNIRFTAGTNFEEGLRFRYVRINMHSLGLYVWEGHTDSQMGISEVQCYGSETIAGEAKLQGTDPDAPLYDKWGLLEKYGYITHVARGGQPDRMLFTQALADLDARYTLEEIVRLMDRVEIRSPWLPGVPVFSTIRVVNEALGIERTFFVENREAGADGDSYSGSTLP